MTTTAADLYTDLQPYLKDPKPAPGSRIWSFCPAHADGARHHRRSLSLHPKYGLVCFAGCAFKDILDALGYRWQAKEPPPFEREEGPQRIYQYISVQGDVVAEKGRFEKDDGSKSFSFRRPDGEWKAGLSPMRVSDLPLYNAPAVSGAENGHPVYLVEGEKAADACITRGLLATTLAGGAGSKDFGDALQLLKGRTVILWPDNDPPGREHMVRVHAHLRDIASRIAFMSCPRPLPTKGDAYDYFAMGGTAEELAKGAITEPVVEYLATDSLRILHPTVGMTFEFTFEHMTASRNALESELTILLQGQKQDDAFCQRFNVLSASQRTELRRDMESIYGKEYGWAKVLNTVTTLARHRFEELDRGMDTVDIQPSAESGFLLKPILVSDAPNILFGDGGSFKSYLAFHIALRLSKQTRILVVDYEDNQANFRRRINRLLAGTGQQLAKNSLWYWQAHGIPFADQAEALKLKVSRDGIGLVIVDSAGPACGGRPEDAEVALAYFRALASLKTTTLSICHVPKQGDPDKPLGSAFWHNEARRTWLIQRVQEDDSDEIDIGLVCKKVNDGRRPSPLSFHIAFDGEEGAVTIKSQAYANIEELAKKLPLPTRILSVLVRPMTAQEITDEIGEDKIKVEHVLRALRKSDRLGKTVKVGERVTGSGQKAAVWAKAETHRNEPPF